LSSISEMQVADAAHGSTAAARRICAIVVTYHPPDEFPRVIGRILPQVGAIVIVDNGSDEAKLAGLREIAAHPPIHLICNGENLGIAKALNLGIEKAVALGYAWVLLFDQDSYPNADMVETLDAVRASFPDPAHLAVIGSGYDDELEMTGAEQGQGRSGAERGGVPWQDVESVITSGSLLSLAAFAAIGPFREEFFIDHVDTEYCLRARLKHYRVIKTRAALMSHAIGAPTTHRMLWMRKRTTNHAPDRRYYFTRNDTVLLRERGKHPAGLWMLKALMRSLRTCKRILLYEQMKTEKINAVMRGWWDGVRGRLGPRKRR
jgi:rhamnosyltransferase